MPMSFAIYWPSPGWHNQDGPLNRSLHQWHGAGPCLRLQLYAQQRQRWQPADCPQQHGQSQCNNHKENFLFHMWPQLLLAHIIPAVAPGVPAEAVVKGVCISWGYSGTHLSYGCIVLAVQAAKPETKPLHCLKLPLGRRSSEVGGWHGEEDVIVGIPEGSRYSISWAARQHYHMPRLPLNYGHLN